MKTDLENKFQSLKGSQINARLFVLWLTQRLGDEPVAMLPPATATEWNKAKMKRNATLVLLDASEARSLLAINAWQGELSQVPAKIPDDVLSTFVFDQFRKLLTALAAPAEADK
jgi:hypothetical protein